MSEVIQLQQHSYKELAVSKIREELKSFKGDRYCTAVKDHVASTLIHFCEENARFAEVVFKTKRTLSDCCAEVMKGCGQSISDIDVYRGAVRNYFPNADVEFHMTITINGDAPSEAELNREVKKPKPEKPKAQAAKPKTQLEKPQKKPAPQVKTKKEPKPAKPQEPEIIQLSLW